MTTLNQHTIKLNNVLEDNAYHLNGALEDYVGDTSLDVTDDDFEVGGVAEATLFIDHGEVEYGDVGNLREALADNDDFDDIQELNGAIIEINESVEALYRLAIEAQLNNVIYGDTTYVVAKFHPTIEAHVRKVPRCIRTPSTGLEAIMSSIKENLRKMIFTVSVGMRKMSLWVGKINNHNVKQAKKVSQAIKTTKRYTKPFSKLYDLSTDFDELAPILQNQLTNAASPASFKHTTPSSLLNKKAPNTAVQATGVKGSLPLGNLVVYLALYPTSHQRILTDVSQQAMLFQYKEFTSLVSEFKQVFPKHVASMQVLLERYEKQAKKLADGKTDAPADDSKLDPKQETQNLVNMASEFKTKMQDSFSSIKTYKHSPDMSLDEFLGIAQKFADSLISLSSITASYKIEDKYINNFSQISKKLDGDDATMKELATGYKDLYEAYGTYMELLTIAQSASDSLMHAMTGLLVIAEQHLTNL